MSKLKINFSLLVGILLVFMATSAFAAMPSEVPMVQLAKSGNPIAIKDGVMSLKWTATTGATSYVISVENADGVDVEVPAVEAIGDEETFDFPYGDVTVGESQVIFKVQAKDGADVTAGKTVTAYAADGYNAEQVGDPGDNGAYNANRTGDPLKINKAKSGHRTHGNYQNNTNSCAGCHQTHTAAADALLFKSSVYDTCIACHDGTLGQYNVFETDRSKDLGAGTFGGTVGTTGAMGNMSVHLSNGTVSIGAAPGANALVDGPTWSSEFTCSSCHDAHGSYSDRLLTSNPNGMAHVARTINPTESFWYGNEINDLPVQDGYTISGTTVTATQPTTLADRKTAITGLNNGIKPVYTATFATSQTVKAVRTQITAADLTTSPTFGGYAGVGLNENDWIIQLYRFDMTNEKWEVAPYLQHYAQSADGIRFATATDGTVGGDLNGQSWSYKDANGTYALKANAQGKVQVLPGWYVNGALGFAKIGRLQNPADSTNYNKYRADGTTTAWTAQTESEVAQSIKYITDLELANVVKLPLTQVVVGGVPQTFNNLKLMEMRPENIVNKTGANAHNAFCATCHIDYLTGKNQETGNTVAGTEKKFHHTMSSNYACVRCHYAHGTDATWMMDASGKTYDEMVANGVATADAMDHLRDVNESSALKRYTNMAVCYGCHTSSHAENIVGSGSYGTTSDQVMGINPDGTPSYLADQVQNPKATRAY